MDTKAMETKIKELEKKVAILEDLEAIKRLQRSYGYYIEHWMYEELIDCFADSPDTVLNISVGIFLGKEGIRRYFSGEKERSVNPEVLHQIMQLSGIVDIAEDGKTAEGRWYGFGLAALPQGKGIIQNLTSGIYTAMYIKEGGKWKIHQLKWNPVVYAAPDEGWVKRERLDAAAGAPRNPPPRADKPRDVDTLYPSGYVPPFHYRHPVTGKETSAKKYRASK
jgi:hypothetical protein